MRELDLIGRTVGQAFQIIDDDLDLFSTEEALGKPISGDVREGKRMIFYYLLSRRLPAERWAELPDERDQARTALAAMVTMMRAADGFT